MTTFKQITDLHNKMWECKQCHRLVPEEETVAYHLVNKILYGWCESCFKQRAVTASGEAELAA